MGSVPAELEGIALFEGLDPVDARDLLDGYLETRHPAEQVLVLEQDWGDALFVMRSGLAKVRSFSADGEEVVLSLLGPGDVFGEMALLDGQRRSADVVALVPVTVMRLRGGLMRGLLEKRPSLALNLARLEATRLRDLNGRFAVQTSDGTTRLLAALAYLARKSTGANDPLAPMPPLAQRELALLAGLARETASRTLSRLRSRGTVVSTAEGGLQLTDLEPLRKRGLVA